jgi:protein arginine N-methyltransferase 5
VLLRVPLAARPGPLAADPWARWARLAVALDYDARVSIALELPPSTEEEGGEEEEEACLAAALDRWFAEPVRVVLVPVAAFVDAAASPEGLLRPCLPPPARAALARLLDLDPAVVLCGVGASEPAAARAKRCVQYLSFIAADARARDGDADAFERPYYDVLQHPLQPLMDNLESAVYETFERDPVKYRLYQRALFEALATGAADPPLDAPRRPVVVMVLGAGRGPLVRAALAAARAAKREIELYAIEKNPNALVTLRNLAETDWRGLVTVVETDMRVWDPPRLADLIVSELLGSFADNELSPECIDGAHRLLRPGGVCIPQSYTNFAVPTMTPRIYSTLRGFGDSKRFEIPYVVKVHNCYHAAAPQACFSFYHPNPDGVDADQRRHVLLRFVAESDAVVHGFTGFFECTLFGSVRMSILPSTHSDDMVSWFPLFFPLQQPVHLRRGDPIEFALWRRTSARKVWYEWCVPDRTALHNPLGRSYAIGT